MTSFTRAVLLASALLGANAFAKEPGATAQETFACRQDCEALSAPCIERCVADPLIANDQKATSNCIIACDKQQMPCFQKCANQMPKSKKKKKKKK